MSHVIYVCTEKDFEFGSLLSSVVGDSVVENNVEVEVDVEVDVDVELVHLY